MPRRLALPLLAAALLVAGVGTLAAWNPRGYLALHPLDHPLAAWALAWGLAGAAVLAWRPPARVVALLVLPALSLGWWTGWAALFATPSPTTVLRRAVSTDGRYEVRLVEGRHLVDPFWEARVRTRRGLLSREYVVWTSVEDVPPVDVRFGGDRTVEVVDQAGTVHAAAF